MSNTFSSDSSPAAPAAPAPIAERRGAYFDSLFEGSDDPWQFRRRWYEQRKRALTLACLPHARYAAAYEPGCANGELSAALAERCDRLLISDGAEAAVGLARKRVASQPHVEVVCAWVPDDWPNETFDLIVISEFGYYLSVDSLAGLAERVLATLRPDGVVLACHWRRPIEGCNWAGDAVHDALAQRFGHPTGDDRRARHEASSSSRPDRADSPDNPDSTDTADRTDAEDPPGQQVGVQTTHSASIVDADFRLDVWTADPRSVAQREALT